LSPDSLVKGGDDTTAQLKSAIHALENWEAGAAPESHTVPALTSQAQTLQIVERGAFVGFLLIDEFDGTETETRLQPGQIPPFVKCKTPPTAQECIKLFSLDKTQSFAFMLLAEALDLEQSGLDGEKLWYAADCVGVPRCCF